MTHKELPPDGSTHWSTRTMAARVGIGKDAVAKIWADHNLEPSKSTRSSSATIPRFEEKLVDGVGVYLNPPARAVVFSFDEKTQCQALDRTRTAAQEKAPRSDLRGAFCEQWSVGVQQFSFQPARATSSRWSRTVQLVLPTVTPP